MSQVRPKWATAARWYAAILLFVAPLKFGGVIGLGDEAFFPIGGWQWVFFAWPPFLVSFLAGLGYVLAAVAYPPPPDGRGRWPVLAWSALAGTALLGLLRTTEWDYALAFIPHLASAAVFAAAMQRLLAHDPAARRLLLGALAAGTLWCCVSGVKQHFGGLQETQLLAEQQAAANGQVLDSGFRDKLRQTRVYGPFQIANLYAAHLVLVAPLMLLVLWRLGDRFEPTRISRPLLTGLGALAFLGALYWSGSRGAVLGLAGGLALAALALPALRRWRIPIVLACLVLGVGLMFAVGSGRNLLSASARLQYYRSAWTMFRAHPLSGVGLGEFFPYHLKLKPLGAEPTRMPHNFPLGLLAQAGILGGLGALACLLLPLWLAFAREGDGEVSWHDRAERLAVIVGLGAWSIHSLVDLNIQVPATVLTAACLPLLGLGETARATESASGVWGPRLGRIGQLVLLALALLGVWRLPGEHAFQEFTDAIQAKKPADHVWKRGRAASRLLPTNSNPDRILAWFAQTTGNAPGAIAAYEQAIHRSPHRAALWANLARLRLQQNDLAGAAAAIAVAVEWNPGHPRYQAQLALVRGLRVTTEPPQQLAPLVVAALAATYDLDEKAEGPPAMNIQIGWPRDLPLPAIPLQQLADWLSPHAGTVTPDGLPIRFRVAAQWTNGQ